MKLIEESKLKKGDGENAKIRFLYLGSLYTIERQGDVVVSQIPKYDAKIAFNVMVHVVANPTGGRKTRKIRRH
jgi:hypothetical protein